MRSWSVQLKTARTLPRVQRHGDVAKPGCYSSSRRVPGSGVPPAKRCTAIPTVVSLNDPAKIAAVHRRAATA